MSSYDLLVIFFFFLASKLGYFSLVVEEMFPSSWVTPKNKTSSTTDATSIWILKT